MSYRFDQLSSEIVIDGFENGIAPSPYKGIANMRNMNTTYYPGVAYTNYRRQAATVTVPASNITWYAGAHSTNVSDNFGWIFTASTSSMTNPVQHCTSPAGLNYILDDVGQIWKQSAVNSSTFNRLENGNGRFTNGAGGIAYWNNYLVVFGGGVIEFCGDGTGDAAVISSNWNLVNSGESLNSATFTTNFSAHPTYITLSNASFYNRPVFQVNDQVQFSSTGSLPTGLTAGTTYYILTLDSAGFIMTVSATMGGSAVSLSSDGSGTLTVTVVDSYLPLGNSTSLSLLISSSTSGTISSYINPQGVTVTSNWQQASGTYLISVNGGQSTTLALFTYNSPTVSFLSPLQYISSSSPVTIQIVNSSVTSYRPYVSKVDGNLYFMNGRYLGRILSTGTGAKFNPAVPVSYSVSYGATALLDPNDSITDMTDLQSNLIISGQSKVYTWDYVSTQTYAPVPIGEPIKRVLNLLNNVYVFAGQKGNVYISNGSYAQLLTKIPDYIVGVIDPVWTYGGVMTHRSRIFFQAFAQNTSGTNLLQGTFSILVSPSILGEVSQGINMEAQNSAGLIPASGAKTNGILIDNEPSSNGQDSYYSAYSTGASAGSIDYNDTTLWQNFEPTIETDMIPIGTFLKKGTLGQIQFKLDRPMATGDEIRVYARASLSDTYTLVGTTTSTVLGDAYPSNLSQSQWIQLEIQTKAAASGSSFIPIREIRVQYNPESS